MRLVVLLLAALSMLASAAAQDANTTNESNDTGGASAGNGTDPSVDENATGAPDAPVEAPQPIVIEIEGVQEGAPFFRDPETGARNPTLTVQPGQQVTFKLTVVSGVHNFRLASGEKTALLSDGEEGELVWTAPADATTIEYWCDPHKAAGMKGVLRVGGAASGGDAGGEEGEITGETIDLSQFDPACEGRVAPAVVTTGVTGGPTLEDYTRACSQTAGEEGPVRERHAADLVIPLSWAAIALGIGGVVWVHKYYKP